MLDLPINLDATTSFLVNLLNIPSPTGYHREAIPFVQRAFEAIPGVTVNITPKGALIATVRGKSSSAPRAVSAHADTLGAMVKEIKGSGRLKLTTIGGVLWNTVEFENVTIRTFEDQRYRGTIMAVNANGHVNNKLGEQARTADLMEVRIDARTTSAAETRALGIEVGDFVFLDPRVEVVNGFIRSRHLDNKAGVAAIYGALMAMQMADVQPAQDTYVLISNYEEVGHGGSNGLPADLAEFVCVDMGALGDGQSGDEFSVSICVKDSSGPYHFDLTNKVRRLCQRYDIPHKLDIYPYYGSDGSAYWRAGGGARVALIGPGVDTSHGYERTHTDSIQHTAHLIARYLLDEE
jgi:putative aminopeptidase FrvX